MNILVAPNSLKNAASSFEIAVAVEAGIKASDPGASVRKLPLADGGEYTMDIMLRVLGGNMVTTQTVDPIGRSIDAVYGITNDNKAIVELTKASGYELVRKNDLNPLFTSTYGTGIQIRDAIQQGCRDIFLTLGGSATVDGGSGILSALGIALLDRDNKELPRGGGNLIILDKFDTSGIIKEANDITFTILCDVNNPLLGEQGAAMVFAPQKGAGIMETMVLERCLANFGATCEKHSGKHLVDMEGAGAAGGVAVGLKTFFKTKILSGTEFVLDILEADRHIKWADVIITAEGTLDKQTYGGKAPAVIAERAKKAGKKIICIAGSVPHRSDQPDKYFDAVFSLQNKPMSVDESIQHTLENIKNVSFEIGRLITGCKQEK